MSRYSELIQKEVINIKDGCLLGCIRDLEIDECDGRICAVVLQGESRFLGLLGSSSECQIPWEKICKISNVVMGILHAHTALISILIGIILGASATDLAFLIIGYFYAMLVMPGSCVLSVVLSVWYRKKRNYPAALMIQFLPMIMVGLSVVLFFIFMVF